MPQEMSLRAKIASLWLVGNDLKGGGDSKRVGWFMEVVNLREVIFPA